MFELSTVTQFNPEAALCRVSVEGKTDPSPQPAGKRNCLMKSNFLFELREFLQRWQKDERGQIHSSYSTNMMFCTCMNMGHMCLSAHLRLRWNVCWLLLVCLQPGLTLFFFSSFLFSPLCPSLPFLSSPPLLFFISSSPCFPCSYRHPPFCMSGVSGQWLWSQEESRPAPCLLLANSGTRWLRGSDW